MTQSIQNGSSVSFGCLSCGVFAPWAGRKWDQDIVSLCVFCNVLWVMCSKPVGSPFLDVYCMDHHGSHAGQDEPLFLRFGLFCFMSHRQGGVQGGRWSVDFLSVLWCLATWQILVAGYNIWLSRAPLPSVSTNNMQRPEGPDDPWWPSQPVHFRTLAQGQGRMDPFWATALYQ